MISKDGQILLEVPKVKVYLTDYYDLPYIATVVKLLFNESSISLIKVKQASVVEWSLHYMPITSA